MTSPVKVACDALRSDAKKWTEISGEVQAAGQSANGLLLSSAAGNVVRASGVVAAYDALRVKLSGLLGGAATEFGQVSGLLTKVADTYQREDDEGAHRIAKAGAN